MINCYLKLRDSNYLSVSTYAEFNRVTILTSIQLPTVEYKAEVVLDADVQKHMMTET